MSEYINNSSKREEQLKEIIKQLHAGRAFSDLKDTFQDLLKGASAQEIVHIEQALIAEGLPGGTDPISMRRACGLCLKNHWIRSFLPNCSPGTLIYYFSCGK